MERKVHFEPFGRVMQRSHHQPPKQKSLFDKSFKLRVSVVVGEEIAAPFNRDTKEIECSSDQICEHYES